MTHDSDLDDLLQPTVSDDARPRGPLPWRLQSQFWVAFFGGAFGVTAVALLNAMRLGVDAKRRGLIVLAGLAGIAGTAVSLLWIEKPFDFRVTARIVAVALFLVLRMLQKPADDHHQVFRHARYASLWLPGILLSLIGGLVNYAIFRWIGALL